MESDIGDWVVINKPYVPPPPTDDNGRSALQAARDGEDAPTISRLVQLEKDKFWGLYPYTESRSLALAAQDGDLRVVDTLLAAGDDFNGIVYDFSSSALENAAAGGHYEIVKRLLNVERDVTTSESYFDRELLDAAVENGQHEEVYRLKQNERLLSWNQKHRDMALNLAAGQDDLRIVEALVDAGAVLNSKHYTPQHPSAITAAAGAGHLHMVDYFLRHGASVAPIQTDNTETPLRAAAEGGHLEVIERLVLEGADVNASKALHGAAGNGHLDVVRRLLEVGALVDPEKQQACPLNTPDGPRLTREESTALQSAAKGGHLKIVELLLQKGADVNAPPSEWGRTALQAAAEGGFVEIVKALVAAGADVNALGSKGGLTALQAGVKNGSLEVIDILLDNGAVLETEVQGRASKSALVMAAEQGSLDIVRKFPLQMRASSSLEGDVTTSLCVKALNRAIEKAHRDVVRHLLAIGTPAIRDKESNDALLRSAVNSGDIELLKILLEGHADLEDKCLHYGQPQPTALQGAVQYERLDMAELLVKEGANVNGGEGATPPVLHIASKNGNLPLVKLLLTAGADVNVKDYEGITTLEAGEVGGNKEVLRLLQMRQVKVQASLAAAADEDAMPIERPLESPDTEGKPLCTTCGPRLFDIFQTSRTYASQEFDWHPSLTALDVSAKTGCPFCVFFKKQLGNEGISMPQSSKVRLRHEFGPNESIWGNIQEPYPKDSLQCRRIAINFHFVTEPFEGKRKPVPGTTSSPETFAQIRSWLSSCDSGHQKCRPCFTPGFQPTRLIDLGISKDQGMIRLIDTKNASLESPKYITLSYCDGERPIPSGMTTEASLRSHYDSIPMAYLPLTFVHAIEIATKLDIRYLWIRNLCIIQDSEEDQDRESHLISQIYMNAYCTIAASESEDTTGGIFRTLPSKEYSKVEFECTSAKGERQKVLAFKATPMRWTSMQEKFPLSKRTWTFLELQLSPRVLHFTGSQVLWECATSRAMECWPTDNMPKEWPYYPRPPRLLNWLVDPRDINVYDFWHQAVKDFTCRQSKEPGEILLILACLARVLGSRIEGKYIAGIWEKDLRRSLAWSPIHYNPIHYSGRPRKRHPKYLAPSWSWASVDGPTHFDTHPRHPPSPSLAHEDGSLEVISHSLSLSATAKDEFGPLLSAELRISTPIIKAIFGYDPHERAYGNVIHLKDPSGTKSYGEMSFDVLAERGDLKIISCVYLFKQNGIAILPVNGRDGYYRRVGAISGIPLEHFQNKAAVEITLI